MNTAASSDPRIQEVRVTRDQIIAHLVDGRVISVPIAWSWRLSEASPAQRANFRLIGTGQGIHWPDVDEDISVEGMLRGTPAPRPRSLTQPVVEDAAAGNQTPGEGSEYRLERDPRFLDRIAAARRSLRAGKGVKLEKLDD